MNEIYKKKQFVVQHSYSQIIIQTPPQQKQVLIECYRFFTDFIHTQIRGYFFCVFLFPLSLAFFSLELGK